MFCKSLKIPSILDQKNSIILIPPHSSWLVREKNFTSTTTEENKKNGVSSIFFSTITFLTFNSKQEMNSQIIKEAKIEMR